MKKVNSYRETLRELGAWDAFLLQESGLPGPRANLELAHAVADEGDDEMFRRFLAFDAEQAPTNSPHEYLAFCGVLGVGRLVAEGRWEYLQILRHHASDPRWRIREAVAQALQRLGKVAMDALVREMERWSAGDLLEKRAVAAALCEPSLLREKRHIERTLRILGTIMASIQGVEDRRSDEFRALRKGLGYCWSVAVVALPDAGKAAMEHWFSSDDRDVQWIMRENLKKGRLARMDAEWVKTWKAALG